MSARVVAVDVAVVVVVVIAVVVAVVVVVAIHVSTTELTSTLGIVVNNNNVNTMKATPFLRPVPVV